MNASVLSHYQADQLLNARQAGQETQLTTLDLGLTSVEAVLEASGVRFPHGLWISWEQVNAIHDAENSCFLVEGVGIWKIQYFSETSNQLFSLYPTDGAPTMLVSGIPMHRIKGIDPHRDTLEKIKAVRPLTGRVLDTATGLGYTAIEAAKTARFVVTIEIDPAALAVAHHNPWSQKLFENPKIHQVRGDSFEIIPAMRERSFDCIIHDPPAIQLYGELYSGEFYCHLYRILRQHGKLFHYIGDPESRSGASTTAGVVRRLRESGFKRVLRAPQAFGVVAYK